MRLPTKGVPAEFAVTLIDAAGRQIDRCSWDEMFNRPEGEQPPGSLEGRIARWLSEGEH